MDKLQVADLIQQTQQELTPDEFLVALATKAAEWEREQCAKVCDLMDEHGWKGAEKCAEAIRARSNNGG